MELIQEIKSKLEILSLVKSYISVKKSGRDYLAICPFHSDKTPSMHISEQKQIFKCFACGAGGDAIEFYRRYNNLEAKDAIRELAEKLGVEMKSFTPVDKEKKERLLSTQELMGKVSDLYASRLADSPAEEYLLKRGVSRSSIREFGLGFVSDDNPLSRSKNVEILKRLDLVGEKDGISYDFFRSRLIFPIADARGVVVGFAGRSLNDRDQPKYINSASSELFDKSRILYGLHQASRARARSLIITEGYMDVIALHEAGIKNSICVMGTAFTTSHIKLSLRYSKTLIFCFDGDLAGKNATERIIPLLMSEITDDILVYFLSLPPKDDPDSFVRREGRVGFETYMDSNKVSLTDYLLNHKYPINSTTNLDEKAVFIKELTGLISMMPDSNKKKLLEQAVSIHLSATARTGSFTGKKENKKMVSDLPDLSKKNKSNILSSLLITDPSLAQRMDLEQYEDVITSEERLLLDIYRIVCSEGDIITAELVARLDRARFLVPVLDDRDESFKKNWSSYKSTLMRRQKIKQMKR